MQELTRCSWGTGICQTYHDEEWGVPSRNDRHLFEMLTLEGAQAGLSWATILKRRATYREAFADFEIEKVARFGEKQKADLLQNVGIIRNRAKIESTIVNAIATLGLQEKYGSFSTFLWSFTDGNVIQNHWQESAQMQASTPVSDRMSKELKKHGFSFVGTTICYSLMQAVGIVNDHTISCFRYRDLVAQVQPDGESLQHKI